MYKILWIDDQYEGLSELMERCEVIEGFEITKCRFAVEGMKEYEKHLEQWSAVVLDAKVGIPEDVQEQSLNAVSGYPFHNTSRFTMKSFRTYTNPISLRQDFIEYLDGFSHDVQDIIDKFKLKQQVDNLSDADRLGTIIEKFTDDKFNLGINPIVDDKGNERIPGVDNHTMGTLFEQLLRKFNEENSVTEAGEHFTPRDYVALLADIAVLPVADKLTNATYRIYDGACGTGGILSIAEERINEVAQQRGKRVNITLYGQELQPETYATCKADLMLSNNSGSFQYTHAGAKRERFFCGSTISNDGHPGMKFDFCISNPPFGTPWKEDMKAWGLKENEKDKISDKRFVVPRGYTADTALRFVPGIGDPQMLFLANNVSRIKDDTELGTRIVEVHNGSSLFTGNAGGGESNLRKYIIENDMLEAIIAMPEKDFYNTGIGTFIWVVTNKKAPHRQGRVQLIDATAIKTPLRKNLGEKNCETNEEDRRRILQLLLDFVETPESKIFPNEEFGYTEITVERPLRLRVLPVFDISNIGLKATELERCVKALRDVPEDTPLDDWNKYAVALKLPKTLLNKIRPFITERDENAVGIEGEADKLLTDVEQVPLLYPGGVEAFMQNEVLPYASDAYINEEKTVIGYELSFTKYFYKPIELRSLGEIAADIRNFESVTGGLLNEILSF